MAESIIEQKSVTLNTDSPVTTKRRRRTLQSKTSIDNSIDSRKQRQTVKM